MNSGSGDFAPALSDDGRILVFATRRTEPTLGDLWFATRATTGESFGTPVEVPTVNTNGVDKDPALSRDACRLYFASDLGTPGFENLYVATMLP